ncbi:protein argonaute-2-like isoform X1 [Montipora foliosa]|uniref:protein argonaute-2-like isoform X1 n=1 Tax=Montipora foliosa TaxID=591990 RepID=UPI0035F1E09E
MPKKKSKGRGGRGRGNLNGQEELPRPGRSENGASAEAPDREERLILSDEKLEGGREEKAEPSQGRSSPEDKRFAGSSRPSVTQEKVDREAKAEEKKPSSIDERPSPGGTAPGAKASPSKGAGKGEKSELEGVSQGKSLPSSSASKGSSHPSVTQEKFDREPKSVEKKTCSTNERPGTSETAPRAKASPSSKGAGKEEKSKQEGVSQGKSLPSSSASKEGTQSPGRGASAVGPEARQDVSKLAETLGSSFTVQDHVARQSSGNGLRPPKRPSHGTVGRPIKLRANFFQMNISPKLTYLYHYDVEIIPNKCPKVVKRDVVNQIIQKYKKETFQGHEPAFDGEKNLISAKELPSPVELSVVLPGEDGGKDRTFKVKIQFAASVSLVALKAFLDGKQNGKMAQDAVQALDIVLRQIPSTRFTPIGRSFFPFNGRGRPIGEGCEVQFGFYQSVRPSEWKAMLVNIDVSAKGFYKSQPVIDFLCETLDINPGYLEDRRFQIDKEKFKKAISGVRIETTHVQTMKRKYTVWEVSGQSADRLQFDIEDETTGRRSKTTVAQYFYDRYRIQLNYPHLPCLKVGQKKDRYLPMEVCTIIPCQKRHLSEQQTANMIRSTARPAPERQRDIQYWVQEMKQTSEKYLRGEFQTTVNPEMVAVGGRVLPAPKLKLGPQDQGLIPREGSWDMRNQKLFDGARIDTWALACFATMQRCNQDTLRRFCDQMSSVSTREGMKMTAQPNVVRYARDSREVEGLFSKWSVEIPSLQLIMIVLPGNDKWLYKEVKRVGDSVVGIPTQCVQLKLAQQAKPQVCANISLKINAKLGGTNHVIDYSVKPVFIEPTIVFGADVTHPSPTENGIPSIAAVVASMDSHASKYQARVRAQRHDKGRGAQEIINDLAVIVRELLIEFYKANGKLKPSKIIFYRDGVSEGQFDQVLAHEVRAVQEACMKLEKGYRPRITFVVVQKRHHTRLFCEDERDASGKARNVPPGTTVDSGITHPYEFDFYLCSHYGIQGTSRPTHYHVLYDDNNFTADSLQQLTYQLCHVYARCTRSVSMPAPAFYAHLAAFHARVHVTNGNSGHVDLEKCAKAIQVSDKMKGVMYFT